MLASFDDTSSEHGPHAGRRRRTSRHARHLSDHRRLVRRRQASRQGAARRRRLDASNAPDGVVELDLRITLETDDGALVHMTFEGIRDDGAPGAPYFRRSPRFETADTEVLVLEPAARRGHRRDSRRRASSRDRRDPLMGARPVPEDLSPLATPGRRGAVGRTLRAARDLLAPGQFGDDSRRQPPGWFRAQGPPSSTHGCRLRRPRSGLWVVSQRSRPAGQTTAGSCSLRLRSSDSARLRSWSGDRLASATAGTVSEAGRRMKARCDWVSAQPTPASRNKNKVGLSIGPVLLTRAGTLASNPTRVGERRPSLPGRAHGMHLRARMRSTRSLGFAAAALAAAGLLGCTRESSRGPVGWAASHPASPAGQTVAQSWSRSTSSDKVETGSDAPRAPSLVPVAIEAPPSTDACDRPLGVTNAQPPTPKWPYDGVTLELAPTPRPAEPPRRDRARRGSRLRSVDGESSGLLESELHGQKTLRYALCAHVHAPAGAQAAGAGLSGLRVAPWGAACPGERLAAAVNPDHVISATKTNLFMASSRSRTAAASRPTGSDWGCLWGSRGAIGKV